MDAEPENGASCSTCRWLATGEAVWGVAQLYCRNPMNAEIVEGSLKEEWGGPVTHATLAPLKVSTTHICSMHLPDEQA